MIARANNAAAMSCIVVGFIVMIINSQACREDNMLLLQHNQTFYNQ